MAHIKRALTVLAAVSRSRPSHIGEKQFCIRVMGAETFFESYSPNCDVQIKVEAEYVKYSVNRDVYFNAERAIKIFESIESEQIEIKIEESRIIFDGSGTYAELELLQDPPSYNFRIRQLRIESAFILSSGNLIHSLAAEYAIDQDNARFKSLNLEYRQAGDRIEFRGVGTNGRLLAINGTLLETFENSVCIAKGAIDPIRKFINGFGAKAKLILTTGTVYIEAEGAKIAISLSELNRIHFLGILPNGSCITVNLENYVLVNAVESAAIFMKKESGSIPQLLIRFTNGNMIATAEDDYGRIDKVLGMSHQTTETTFKITFEDFKAVVSNLPHGTSTFKVYDSGKMTFESSMALAVLVSQPVHY